MKFKTVREGEQAIILNHLGEGRLIIGPSRVFLFRERLQKLKRFTASQFEYLIVTDSNGLVKHVLGPCEIFHNPLEHRSVKLAQAIKIDANHMVVLYRRIKDNSVERQVVMGPSLLVPTADEWLHKFEWHGTDPSNKTRMIPGYKKFTQLTAIPDQFYYNVRDVRTADDAMLTVKLMIFYELTDVIKLLETTHDPIADMVNAVCADVIAFAGKLSYEAFVSSTQVLSDLESYAQLLQRADRIGYRVNRVVFRGYHASDQLQAMQDKAIQARTQLRLGTELNQQKQKLQDFKLNKQQARIEQKQAMEKQQVEHQQKLDKMMKLQELKIQQSDLAAKLECEELEAKTELEFDRAKMQHNLQYLQKLKGIKVDLTRYLVNQQPAAITQELQVVPPGGSKRPSVSERGDVALPCSQF